MRAYASPAQATRRGWMTKDAFTTYDQQTYDSSGQFLIGELEKLDPILHEPLTSQTWSRDIQAREDVTVADDVSSYINVGYASQGDQTSGISWASTESNVTPEVSVDVGKTATPLRLWKRSVSYSIIELLKSQQLNRPIDRMKLEGLRLKWNLDVDQMVYIGDSNMGATGLVNSTSVTASNVVNNAAATSTLWTAKTPAEIQTDVLSLENAAWAASGYSVAPRILLVPPAQFSYLGRDAGSMGFRSIYEFIRNTSLCMRQNGVPLEIRAVKWLTGRGASSTDRMVAYTNDVNYVRYPLTQLQPTPYETRDIWQRVTYFCRLGAVEFPMSPTLRYADGI